MDIETAKAWAWGQPIHSEARQLVCQLEEEERRVESRENEIRKTELAKEIIRQEWERVALELQAMRYRFRHQIALGLWLDRMVCLYQRAVG